MKSKQNISGALGKIYVNNNGFLIARITKSNHKEYTAFSFKGFTSDSPESGDTVCITSGVFINTDYGIQLENGCLMVVDTLTVDDQFIVSIESSDAEFHSQRTTISNKPKALILTQQQINCVEAAKKGKGLKIKAYAGTGKTAALVEIAKVLSGKGLYLAYNKAIQINAMKKFPNIVDCRTILSLAYGYFYSFIHGRVETLNPLTILSYGNIKVIQSCQPYELTFLIIKALRRFCNSASITLPLSLLDHPDVESCWQPSKPSKYTNLCRTNVGIILRIIDNIRKKLYVVGGTVEIINLAKSGFALIKDAMKMSRITKSEDLKTGKPLKSLNQIFKTLMFPF